VPQFSDILNIKNEVFCFLLQLNSENVRQSVEAYRLNLQHGRVNQARIQQKQVASLTDSSTMKLDGYTVTIRPSGIA
jgi:hypothetical protein